MVATGPPAAGKGQCFGPGEDPPPPQTWRAIYSRWDLGGGYPRPAEAFRVVRKGNVDDACLRMKEAHGLRTLRRLGAGLWRKRGLSAAGTGGRGPPLLSHLPVHLAQSEPREGRKSQEGIQGEGADMERGN